MGELIHADSRFHELGVVDYIRYDGMISLEDSLEKNDWEVEIPAGDFARYGFETGDYLYFAGGEWGGRVEKFVHLSAKGIIKIGGVTWRGMLARKIILPPDGQSHLVFENMSVGAIITALLTAFGPLFTLGQGDSQRENVILERKRFRYQNVLEAVLGMADDLGGRLELELDADSGQVVLYMRGVEDHSETVEFSGDYDLSYTSTRADAGYNHIIALGRGEQEQRTVRHLWLLPDGTVTDDSTAQGISVGLEDRVALYDYPNCEDEADLLRGAKKRLLKYGMQNSIEFDFDSADIDLPLGDKVGIRDRMIHMEGVKTIREKLLTVSADGVSLRYSVES